MHDRVYLHQYFHVRYELGSGGVDHSWRDLPSANSISSCGSLYCEQLVLELCKIFTISIAP